MAAGQRASQALGIEGGALGLDIGAMRTADIGPLIPIQPEATQVAVERLGGSWDVPASVGIVQPQHERPAMMAGKQVIVGRL
jgi:hypothetical protein